MAAGAGGVDLAVLVVAADEGVMPQTREHLDICRLLGVKAGVIALTKSDLLAELGEEWLALVKADLVALTAGTFLEGAPVVPCSSKTGAGLPELRAALTRAAQGLPQRPSDGPVFLPVDRVFTIKGFGTVVTGTLLSGTLAVEESTALLPGRPGPFRVRGIQVHGQAAPKVHAGMRTAVNLTGVEPEEIDRGMVLVRSGELPETRMLDVELSLLPAVEEPLPRRRKLLLHLGTSQVEATVALLDLEKLEPGETGLAQLRLAAPLAARRGQRFILRGLGALPARVPPWPGGGCSPSPRLAPQGAAALLAPLLEADASGQLRLAAAAGGLPGARAGASCSAARRCRRRRSPGRWSCWAREARAPGGIATSASTSPAEVFEGLAEASPRAAGCLPRARADARGLSRGAARAALSGVGSAHLPAGGAGAGRRARRRSNTRV